MKASGMLTYWRNDANESSGSVALHAASYLVLLSAILGLNSGIGEPIFATTAAITAGIGQIVSLRLRRSGRKARLVEIISLALCLLLGAKMLTAQYASSWILPPETWAIPEMKLAVLLLWIEVLRSFTLVSDDSAVFSAVPAATLLSLAANTNVNADMLAYFLLYLTATCFLLVHRNALNSVCKKGKGFLAEQARSAAAITLLAVLGGAVISIPLRFVTGKMVAAVAPDLVRYKENMLSSMGGESEGIRIMQGPVYLTETPVMQVQIESSQHNILARDWYWRGRVYDRYTGHGWRSTSFPDLQQSVDVNKKSDYSLHKFEARRLIQPKGKVIRVRQKITATRIAGKAVYAASEPVALWLPVPVAPADRFNCWSIPRYDPDHTSPRRYEVISDVADPSPGELEKAGTDYPDRLRLRYLQTSVGTIKARELAEKVTAGLKTPYDKAEAIETYLSSNYTYDMKAPPAPRAMDAVEYFLFTSRSGYCDVFASAMVVMCREIGIPARLATGFAMGEYDPQADVYQVRDSDRHAWAEVYFPNYGWIEFDPVSSAETAPKGYVQDFLMLLRQIRDALVSNPLSPLAILLLITLVMFKSRWIEKFRWLLWGKKAGYQAMGRDIDPRKIRLARQYESMCGQFKRAGLPARGNLAPGEYRELLTPVLGEGSPASIVLDRITEDFEAIRYGGRQPSEEMMREWRMHSKALKQALRQYKGLTETGHLKQQIP